MNGDFLNALPSIFGRYRDVPNDMAGATIVRIGTIPGRDIEGGGLVIDYAPIGGGSKRCVLAFNELGMWIESVEPLAK
jgi:hypothetical protein